MAQIDLPSFIVLECLSWRCQPLKGSGESTFKMVAKAFKMAARVLGLEERCCDILMLNVIVDINSL